MILDTVIPEYLRDYSKGDIKGEVFYKDDYEDDVIDVNPYVYEEVLEEFNRQEATGENSWLDFNIRIAKVDEINLPSDSTSLLIKRLEYIKKYGYFDYSNSWMRWLRIKEINKKLIYMSVIAQLQKLKPDVNKNILIDRTIENIKLLTR